MMSLEQLVEARRSGGSRRKWRNMQTRKTWSSCLWTGKGVWSGKRRKLVIGREKETEGPSWLSASPFLAQLRCDSGEQPNRAAKEVCSERQSSAVLC